MYLKVAVPSVHKLISTEEDALFYKNLKGKATQIRRKSKQTLKSQGIKLRNLTQNASHCAPKQVFKLNCFIS